MILDRTTTEIDRCNVRSLVSRFQSGYYTLKKTFLFMQESTDLIISPDLENPTIRLWNGEATLISVSHISQYKQTFGGCWVAAARLEPPVGSKTVAASISALAYSVFP